MKFGKQYSEFLEKEEKLYHRPISYVKFKRYKKLFKACAAQHVSTEEESSSCTTKCEVCDGDFFSNLMKDILTVTECVNTQAQQLLDAHLAKGFQKILLRLSNKYVKDHNAIMKEGQMLVYYASMNAIAIQKILKKYDKVHYSANGRAFKSQLLAMHKQLLQSPWLIELKALQINLKGSKNSTSFLEFEGVADCFCLVEDGKLVISCTLQDSSFSIDLTCPICLETLFDPVALGCGHIFCSSCACSAASIMAMESVRSASTSSKCAVCRLEGVYSDAMYLPELNLLIKNRCKEYWQERLQTERIERLKQVKKHWDNQLHAFVGM